VTCIYRQNEGGQVEEGGCGQSTPRTGRFTPGKAPGPILGLASIGRYLGEEKDR